MVLYRLTDLLPEREERAGDRPPAPERLAQMCPGCGHRSAFHAIKQALDETDITVADIGCHTLGYLPPYRVGELLMCMGASTGMAAGLTLFNDTRKVVAFLGDSTFFHSGINSLIDIISSQANVVACVLDNNITAMTGHQPHPGSGRRAGGAEAPAIDIAATAADAPRHTPPRFAQPPSRSQSRPPVAPRCAPPRPWLRARAGPRPATSTNPRPPCGSTPEPAQADPCRTAW